jgi:cell division protein FtsI (penicillin-binding protein 3)
MTQLLKAYNTFNNEGIVVTPTLVQSAGDTKRTAFQTPAKEESMVQAVSAKTAKQIHTILVGNVKHGIAMNAQYEGLEIGGKTATAYIYREGKYRREYHSSFYGFANDGEGHKYTIGVMVIRAKAENAYFASRSAVPVFKEVVDKMVSAEYLIPNNERRK